MTDGLFRPLSPAASVTALRWLAVAMLIVGLAIGNVYLLENPRPDSARDYDVHWLAARMALDHAAAGAYDSDALTAALHAHFPRQAGIVAMPSLYPPTSILLTLPMGWLDPVSGIWIFNGVTLGLLLLTGWLLAGWTGLLLVMAAPSVWFCLLTGQNSLFITALLGLGLYSLAQRPALAGLSWGLCLLKPHLALGLPVAALAGRHGRTLYAAATTVLALTGLSLWLWPEAWAAMLAQSPQAGTALMQNREIYERFVTPYGLLRRLGLPYGQALAGHALAAAGALLLLGRVFARSPDPAGRLVALGLTSLLLTPFGYDYDLPVQLLALFGLLQMARRDGLTPAELVLTAGIYILPVISFLTDWKGNVLTLHMLATAGLLAGLHRRSRLYPAHKPPMN